MAKWNISDMVEALLFGSVASIKTIGTTETTRMENLRAKGSTVLPLGAFILVNFIEIREMAKVNS